MLTFKAFHRQTAFYRTHLRYFGIVEDMDTKLRTQFKP